VARANDWFTAVAVYLDFMDVGFWKSNDSFGNRSIRLGPGLDLNILPVAGNTDEIFSEK
jgi:hypothetical protein